MGGFETQDTPRAGSAKPPEFVDWLGSPSPDKSGSDKTGEPESKKEDAPPKSDEPKADAPKKGKKEASQEADGNERSIGEYPLIEFADGWKKFLEKEEIPEGKFFDMLNEFGRQQILGKFDAEKMSEMIKAVEPTSKEELDDVLSYFNKNMKDNGLQLDIKLDDAGKITQLNLRETNDPRDWNAGFMMGANGKMLPYSMRVNLDAPDGPIESRPITADAASLLLAKKMSPLACP